MKLNSENIIKICLSFMAIIATDPRKMHSKFQFIFWIFNIIIILVITIRGFATLTFNDPLDFNLISGIMEYIFIMTHVSTNMDYTGKRNNTKCFVFSLVLTD